MSDTFQWQLPPRPGFPGGPRPPAPSPEAQQDANINDQPNMYQRLTPQQDEAYIPSASRGHKDWATPDFAMEGAAGHDGVVPGPFMPQPRDLAPLLHAIVLGLGRWGSHYSGMPAIAMGNFASAYWDAYQKGSMQRANQNWQQYRQARQMAQDRLKEEIQAAKEGYALYEDNPGKLHQYMMGLAAKYNDQPLINALNGNPAAVERLWQARDAKWRDLAKIKEQEDRRQRQQQQQEEERKLRMELMKRQLNRPDPNVLPPEWGGPVRPGTSSAPSGATVADSDKEDSDEEPPVPQEIDEEPPDEEPPSEEGDREESSTPPPTRIASADTGMATDAGPATPSRDVTAQAAPPPVQPLRSATPEEVNQRIDDIAKGELRGETLPKGIPKQIESRIEARRADLERQLNDIINSGATGQDMLNRIRRFDPSTARTVEDIIHGKRVVPATGGLGGQSASRYDRLTSLASAVRPDWGPEVASFRREFMNANGRSQLTLKAAASMTGAARKVLEALQFVGENEKPPENWIDQIISNTFTGDPRWNNLGSALNSYVEESAKLARGGQSAEGDINRVLKNYSPITMGPKSVRALLANEAGVAVSKIQSEVDSWQSTTWEHNPPPSYNDRAFKYLNALDNLNMMTGQVKQGIFVPDDLKPFLGSAGSRASEIDETRPQVPAGSPSGSKIMYDKSGKGWLVYPDKSVHELKQ